MWPKGWPCVEAAAGERVARDITDILLGAHLERVEDNNFVASRGLCRLRRCGLRDRDHHERVAKDAAVARCLADSSE
jgi:hypothetical protein